MAGAICNGPLAALGEEVEKTEIVSKRKRSLVKSLDAQEKEEGRVKNPKICYARQEDPEKQETSPEEQKQYTSLEKQLETSLEEELYTNLAEQDKRKLFMEEQEQVSSSKSPEPITKTHAKDSSRLSPRFSHQVSKELLGVFDFLTGPP